MKPSKWLFFVSLSLGMVKAGVAEVGADSAESRKPVRLSVSVVKQKDGSMVDRLDLSVLPASSRDGRIPSTPAEWLDRMIDPTRNGLILRQPHLLAEWLDAVTEPKFMTALATVALDPETYPKTLNRLVDPATARNWSESMDPEILMRWMAAGLDPRVYQAVFQHMFDPKKYLRWANAYPENNPNSTVGCAPAPDELEFRKLPDRQQWMQMPVREPKDNPWLANNCSYRY